MAQKKLQMRAGDRVRVTQLRQDPQGEQLPDDVVGAEGVVQWITPGYAGEKGAFEVRLDDGRIFNLYATEIEPAGA